MGFYSLAALGDATGSDPEAYRQACFAVEPGKLLLCNLLTQAFSDAHGRALVGTGNEDRKAAALRMAGDHRDAGITPERHAHRCRNVIADLATSPAAPGRVG